MPPCGKGLSPVDPHVWKSILLFPELLLIPIDRNGCKLNR